MNATDVNELEGKLVLVRSAQDAHNPPTGRRGTLRVVNPAGSGRPVVQVELDFPQMFTTRAHQRVVTLDDEEVAEILASEHYGAFTVTLKDRLDPQSPVE